MPFSRTTSYTCLLKVTSLKAFSSQQSLGLTQFWLHFYPTLPSSFHSGDDRVSPASFQSPVSELFSWLLHILCCARSVAMMPEMLFGHSFVLSWILALLPFVFLTDRGPLASFSFWHFLKCRCPFKRHFKNTFFLYMIVMARWPESLCKPSLTYFSHSPYQSVPSLCDRNEGFDVCIFPLYVFMTISCSLLERHNLFRWAF